LVSRYQKSKTSLDLNEARDYGFSDGSGFSWTICKLCTSLQTDNHTNTSSLNFSGRMLFLTTNQQCRSTEGTVLKVKSYNYLIVQQRLAATTHTHPFNGPLSGTTQVCRYQKGKIYLDFSKARDSEWQWHQLGLMQVCSSLQTVNHAITPPFSFL